MGRWPPAFCRGPLSTRRPVNPVSRGLQRRFSGAAYRFNYSSHQNGLERRWRPYRGQRAKRGDQRGRQHILKVEARPAGRPRAGSTRLGRPTGPGRRGGPPHDRRTAEARRNRPAHGRSTTQAERARTRPSRAGPRPAPATRPEGGRNPEGAEGAPPHRTGSRRARPYAAQRAAFDRQGPAESPEGAFGEGEPASEDGTPVGPAGRSPRTKKARPRAGATERRGQAPPKRPPGSAQIKARPTGRGYRLVAEGGTAGGLPCPRGPGDGRGGRAAPPPEGDPSVARSAAQGARISFPPSEWPFGGCILPFRLMCTRPSCGQEMSIDTYT